MYSDDIEKRNPKLIDLNCFGIRCVALKTSVDQMKERLQTAAIVETELRAELNCLQKERSEQSHSLTAAQEKLKHVQKSLSNSENERNILADRLKQTQSSLNELHRSQATQQDVIQRLQGQVADLEVQKSTIEAQLRLVKFNPAGTNSDTDGCVHSIDEVSGQLMKAQREKNELRLKVEMLNDKLRQAESNRLSKFSELHAYDSPEKVNLSSDYEYDSNKLADSARRETCNVAEHNVWRQENHGLKIKIRHLESLMAEKEAELTRLQTKLLDRTKYPQMDAEKYRIARLKSERDLEIREKSHQLKIAQLENQVKPSVWCRSES